jgi:hypothetical protein
MKKIHLHKSYSCEIQLLKTLKKNLLKLIGNHTMIKRYIILCLIAIKTITGTKNIMY